MRFISIIIACTILLSSGCSASHPSAPQPNAAQIPATRPDRAPAPNLALRLTDEWNIILLYQREYLAKEGPGHRGAMFEGLMKSLGPSIREGNLTRPLEAGEPNPNPVSELEVLILAGQPDRYISGPSGAKMLYRYTDNSLQLPFGYKASKDWAAILDFDNDGILCSVGYNEASVLVPLFDRLSAATRSANDGYLGIVFELRAPPRDGHTYEGPICVIQRVANGSPADRAGLRPGDVVSAINSMHVGDNLPDVMHHVRPGDVVTFTVHPTGKITPSDSRDVRVTIGRRPSAITRP